MMKRIFGSFLVITSLYVFSSMSAQAGFLPEIPDGDCGFGIVKSAPQVDGVAFDFQKVVNGVESQVTLVSGSMDPSDLAYVGAGGTVTYTELAQEGWTLEEIRCFTFYGVDVTQTENSVTFECINPSEFSFGFCIFANRISADKIPTLSEWGMISAALGLGFIGMFFALRRRRAAA